MRLMLCLVAGLAAVVATSSFANAGAKDGRLDVYFIDVEGGAATLFVTPKGESLLIDSGYPGYDFRDRDRIVDVAKNHAKIEQIDHALVSHWHLDHYGNHAALTEKIKIGTFWDRGIPDSLQEDAKFEERIVAYRAASQNQSKAVQPGDRLPIKAGSTPLSMKVVTASRDVIENTGDANPFAKLHEPMPEDKSDNAASVSLLTTFGGFKFLCCGDLTWNIEAKLVTPNNPLGHVDVFMVTHHGNCQRQRQIGSFAQKQGAITNDSGLFFERAGVDAFEVSAFHTFQCGEFVALPARVGGTGNEPVAAVIGE
jgi:competence protein ComEC